MTGKNIIYHLAGALLGFAILETYNTLQAAKTRLDELAAAANDIAEGDPRTRIAPAPRFVLTDAYMPELMDASTGTSLVGILEQLAEQK